MSTGFISAHATTRHASACSACARPISRPSGVAAEFNDMFCALNGATRIPESEKIRPKPAVTKDFPTCEPVPRIMSARTPPLSHLHARDHSPAGERAIERGAVLIDPVDV